MLGRHVRSGGRRRPVLGLAAVACAGAVLAVGVPIGASGAAPEPPPSEAGSERAATVGHDRTDPVEARRVDRVRPVLNWFDCTNLAPEGSPAGTADCATVKLPLDYDQPGGATTQLAVLKLNARDPKRRIGSLFVNPGGPGGSGVGFAAYASQFLGAEVLDRFDVVGFDPRGTNYSDNVRCWRDVAEQEKVFGLFGGAFPFPEQRTATYVKGSKAVGRACSTTGRPLSGAMSTAEVARDMEVLRRALGDSKLTYLGFSYGTYLGTVYANLFPDRVRALALDGTLDPLAWVGTPASQVPQATRLRSAEGAAKALDELLTRCAKAGPAYCAFAAKGDPKTNYAALMAAIKRAPVTVDGLLVDYPDATSSVLSDLDTPDAGGRLDFDLIKFWDAVHGADPARPALPADHGGRDAGARPQQAQHSSRTSGFPEQGPYINLDEAFLGVMCSDGSNPADASRWPGYAAAADRPAPGFGSVYAWMTSKCASASWTVRDEDAYRGPFTRRTASPVLVVGNYWDPQTNYDSAVTLSRLLPGSRLLSSDNWGHTAYGSSSCVTTAVDAYLVSGTLPDRGTVCHGDEQPYTRPLDLAGVAAAPPAPAGSHRRPPVVPLWR